MKESRKKIIKAIVRQKVLLMIEDDKYFISVNKQEREILKEMVIDDQISLEKAYTDLKEMMGKLTECWDKNNAFYETGTLPVIGKNLKDEVTLDPKEKL